jgi:Photosynthesis system II assembly factor YCF48
MERRVYAHVSIVTLLAALGIARIATSCAENASSLDSIDSGPAPDAAATLPPQPSCPAGTWCRVELPRTSPVSFNGIWGSGPDDVWIAGSPGSTLHWNGATLSFAAIETRQALSGVWGSGKDDVWAFSTDRTVWHTRGYDGDDAGWSRSSYEADPASAYTNPATILAMWGASASDVWAVGPSATTADGRSLPSVLHCDGWHDGVLRWQTSATSVGDDGGAIAPVSLHAICGGTSSGIWVVGEGGKTRYTSGWNGDHASWTPINSQTSRALYAVFCGPDGVVWAAGEGGTMARFTRVLGGDYTGEAVTTPTTVSLRAVWGAAADDVWAVGDAGTLLHWDGKEWKSATAQLNGVGDDLFAIWGANKNDLWVAGRNVLLHNSDARSPGGSR